MLRFLYALFFGCFHEKTTFPITLPIPSCGDGEIRRRTYVACLTCGEELAYNWQKMKLEGPCRDLAAVIPITYRSRTAHERLAVAAAVAKMENGNAVAVGLSGGLSACTPPDRVLQCIR